MNIGCVIINNPVGGSAKPKLKKPIISEIPVKKERKNKWGP
jgi:hypothetical protein